MKFAAGKSLVLLALLAPFARAETDDQFLDDLEHREFQFFAETANPTNGLVPDRANVTGFWRGEVSSVSGCGFSLCALCVGDRRGWIPHTDAVARVRATLRCALDELPQEHGFFYHFIEIKSVKRAWNCEVSPMDTALFLCGAMTARQHFDDEEIRSLAAKIYGRADWPWMLNGGRTLALGWKPETGFSRHRWSGYAEHMAMYLLGIGSPSRPLPPECWQAWRREPVGSYAGMTYIMYPPLFVHQFSHAFVDFRGFADDYADYWQNSVLATLSQRRMCADFSERFPGYDTNLWGVTASDSETGYRAWGGPPPTGDIDGSVAPCAAAGSLPFAPTECVAALRNMKEKYAGKVFGRFGFVDAFNPNTGWAGKDVLAIDEGISLVMIENYRSGLVWDSFMANPEIGYAMRAARFRPAPRLAANTSLIDGHLPEAPAHRAAERNAVARRLPCPEHDWDWQLINAANARESVFDGDGKIFARFAFAWDTNALQVRVAVTDPDIINEQKPDRLYLQDCVELFIDPENNGMKWGRARDFQFGFAVTNKSCEWFGRRTLENVTVKSINDGYRVIAAIPWKMLGVEPAPGKKIGVSLAVNSISHEDEPAVKLNWHWREETNGIIRLGTLTLGDSP